MSPFKEGDRVVETSTGEHGTVVEIVKGGLFRVRLDHGGSFNFRADKLQRL